MNWNIEANDINLLSVDTDDEHGLIITCVYRNDSHQVGLTPEQARLIAAAPDMYEALKDLRDWLQSSDIKILGRGFAEQFTFCPRHSVW